MNLERSLRFAAIAAMALLSAPMMLVAQPGAFGGGYGPPLAVVPPPRAFATSDEHYKSLLTAARGGTKHTITSVPRWDGLWVTAGNTHMNSFIDPPGFAGKVRAGVLTPAYEKAYSERWRQHATTKQNGFHSDGAALPAARARTGGGAASAALTALRAPRRTRDRALRGSAPRTAAGVRRRARRPAW